MKAKSIRELEVYEPIATPEFLEQCERRDGRVFAPIGTVFDHPDCYLLVQMCAAEALDDECKAMTVQTPEQRAAAMKAAERLHKGIHPDDFELYNEGKIDGYFANGDYKPGPNWDAWQAEKQAEENKEDI